MQKWPLIAFLIVFGLCMAITQYLAYQQYDITKQEQHSALVNEMATVKERFSSVLNNSISAANSLAIIYKQYGLPKDFDSVAKQILQVSPYVEAIQITEHDTIKRIYPVKGHEKAIGVNLATDSLRSEEASQATSKKETYFSGPRPLLEGGIGILGKLPLMVNNKVTGFSVIITKLPAIQQALKISPAGDNKFAFALLKTSGKMQEAYLLSKEPLDTSKSTVVADIPEGGWQLQVGYSKGYREASFPFELAITGFLLSVIAGVLTYRKINEAERLRKIIARKTVELAASEKYFRTLIETSLDAIVLMDKEGKVLYATESTEKITGYSLEDLKVADGIMMIHPADRDEAGKAFGTLLAKPGNVVTARLRLKHKAGRFIWIDGTYRNLLDDENVHAIVLNYSDITEKIETQQKYQGLVEKSLVGVYIQQNGKLVYANPRLAEEFGYSEREALNMPISKFIYKDDLPIVIENMNARYAGISNSTGYEVRTVRKDGELMWHEIFGTATLFQGSPALIGTMVNITSRKKVFDELVKSEASLRSIFNTTEVSYLLLDVNYNIIALNQQMEDVYLHVAGINLKAGDNLVAALLPEKRQNALDVYNNVIKTNKAFEYESSYKTGDTYKYYVANVIPVNDGHKVIGLCITSVDTTKTKRLELEREKIINDLLHRNRDLQQFAYMVSHNLRGPLSAILGINNLLRESIPESERKFLLQGIKASAEKMDVVINDLAEILQVKDSLNKARAAINLNELLANIKVTMASVLRQYGATVAGDFSSIEELTAIESYLNNIFYNLIANSIKHSKRGVPPVVQIQSQKSEKGVSIIFKDNGIGIDLKKNGKKLFGLYQRFNLEAGGKGLGLFMVKAQLEAMNADIAVESEYGRGTTFTLLFKN